MVLLSMGMTLMAKLDKSSWPVLFVSDQFEGHHGVTEWLNAIVKNLKEQQDITVLFSYTLSDASEVIHSREDMGTIVIDWDMQAFGHEHEKIRHLKLQLQDKSIATLLVKYIRKRNKNLPILLLTERRSIELIPDEVLKMVNGVIWKLTETPEFLAGRIEESVVQYTDTVLPAFFKELVHYVNLYKYAWHTPGHMGGEGFLRSPSGTGFHKFFGENVLRSDLSISVPELGSLLDHSGLTGDAENFSAQVFGADQTYYVLNGTSTANQIVWRSQVLPDDLTLVDRNCHKSLNYAMIITSARPDYMIPMRNKLGIIGPVDFSKIDQNKSYKMSALTNSTYDGVCYDTVYVKNKLKNVNILHFDEAWFAYAKFHPIYRNHFGMEVEDVNKLTFSTQSTHKLLTAFSQAAMIHVKFPDWDGMPSDYGEKFRDCFNESYMMHGSTSPQYSMIASLEVATKMMKDNGTTAWNDIIKEAIELRKKVADIKQSCKPDDWFFGLWQPECIADPDLDIKELAKNQDFWLIKPGDAWHGFAVKDTYVMLDPIKLTFTCPGLTVQGNYEQKGIPAAIVTNFLINRGIVCEKTDYYSWLLLNSLGTSRGKQGTLVAELFKFKELYENEALLTEVFPSLAKCPKYNGKTLKEHCQDMHDYIREHDLVDKMINAANQIPPQSKLPVQAYHKLVEKKVDSIQLRDIQKAGKNRIGAVMIVPYPPGIPILMGGEAILAEGDPRLKYLLYRQDFENEFPGYTSDIHGIERTKPDKDGNVYFETLIIKE